MRKNLFSYDVLYICGIPVKSYNSLLNFEIDFLRELELEGIQEAVKMWEFAKGVADSENISSEKVLEILEGRDKTKTDLLIKYSSGLKELTDRTKVEDKKIRKIAAFVLAHRVDENYFKENKENFLNFFGFDIKKTNDYSYFLPLVEKLPERVTNELVEFLFEEKESGDYSCLSEEKETQETQEAPEKIDKNNLGKRSQSTKKRSQTTKKSTGKESS